MYSVVDCINISIIRSRYGCASAQSFSVCVDVVWIVFNISKGIGTLLVL